MFKVKAIRFFFSICLLTVFIMISGFAPVFAQEIPSGKYLGTYYNGMNFDTMVFSRYDDQINFDWRWGSPDPKINKDNFSIRWQGKFNFDTYLYEFTAIADDGVRVYFDGEEIIDSWRAQSYMTSKARKQVTAGEHTIVVEYFESAIYAAINVYWEKVTPSTASAPGTTTGTGAVATLAPGMQNLYLSECVILEANPIEGNAPLTVSFTGAGYDPYGPMTSYRFNFQDKSSDSIIEGGDYFTDHIYQKPGNYVATLAVKDSKGNWRSSDKCKVAIKITGSGIGEENAVTVSPEPASSVSALPKTGIIDNSIILVIIIASGGFLGAYLYRRFDIS
jgi:LPXTG-motif cell wall-anchored protein